MDDIRENNGDISEADRVKTPASVLRSLSVQKRLGAATQMLGSYYRALGLLYEYITIRNRDTRVCHEGIRGRRLNRWNIFHSILLTYSFSSR